MDQAIERKKTRHICITLRENVLMYFCVTINNCLVHVYYVYILEWFKYNLKHCRKFV